MDELLELIVFARMTPDHDHLNAVDDLALSLFASGTITQGQMQNASALARQPIHPIP